MKRKIVVEITANDETCGKCYHADPPSGICFAFQKVRKMRDDQKVWLRLPECKKAEVRK